MAHDRRWAVGLALLSLVVLLWVVSGFLVNVMSVDYHKPYFITYVNTGLMVLYLPGALSVSKRGPKYEATTQFSVGETAKLSAQFFLLWFLSNLLNNASYVYTTVQSATILVSTSSFFTLIIGSWFGVERFTRSKVWPLLASLVGIYIVSRQDTAQESSPPTALYGNLMALGSAVLYGVYTTLLRHKVRNESNLSAKLFFGFVGLFDILSIWPLLILLNKNGIEHFALPPTPKVWLLMALNGLSILVSDFCWVQAMLMTSPLVVTVGLSATIPLSMLGEIIFYHRVGSFLYFVGAALVFWSFLAINKEVQDDDAACDNPGESTRSTPNSELLVESQTP